MVDFQSRTTRRGRDDAEEEQEEEDEAETQAEEDPEPPDEEAAEPADTPVPDEMQYAVVAVETDDGAGASADQVIAALEGAGEHVVTRESLSPSLDAVQSTVGDLVERSDVSAVVSVGGVGVGPDDVTVGAVSGLFDKQLPGFGELYRVLSHEQEGTAVVRARVTAGLVGQVPVFCLPGSPDGARRGVEQLVLPEAETIAETATVDPGL